MFLSTLWAASLADTFLEVFFAVFLASCSVGFSCAEAFFGAVFLAEAFLVTAAFLAGGFFVTAAFLIAGVFLTGTFFVAAAFLTGTFFVAAAFLTGAFFVAATLAEVLVAVVLLALVLGM
jgi:hypothetical protein